MKKEFVLICITAFAINAQAMVSKLHVRRYQDRVNTYAEEPQAAKKGVSKVPYYQMRKKPSTVGNNFADGSTGDEVKAQLPKPEEPLRLAHRPQMMIDREVAMQIERPVRRPERSEDMSQSYTVARVNKELQQRKLQQAKPVKREVHPAVTKKITHRKKPIKRVRRAASKPRYVEQTIYSIQLIGSSDKNQIMDFLTRYGYKHKADVTKENRYGGIWYSAQLGRYTDKDTAYRVMARLPQDLKVNHPWIKTRTHKVNVTHVAHRKVRPQPVARRREPVRVAENSRVKFDQSYHRMQREQGSRYRRDDGMMEINVTG